MKPLFLSMLLASVAAGAEPKIVLRGTYTKGAEAVPIGDWRNYGVEGATGKLDWEYDPVPELAFDLAGKPYLLTAEVGLMNVTKPLSTFRVEGKELKTQEIAVNDVILHGIAPGKIRLVVRAENSSKRLATLLIDVGPRGPPPIIAPPPGTLSLNFVIVRKDGPPTQDYVNVLALPAWDALRAKGHTVADVTYSDAVSKLNLNLAPGTKLPAVVPSYVKDGCSHRIGLPLPYPTDDTGILKLGEIRP